MAQQAIEGTRRGFALLSGRDRSSRFYAGLNSDDGSIIQNNLIIKKRSYPRRTLSSPACLLSGKPATGRTPRSFVLPQSLFDIPTKYTRENGAATAAAAAATTASSSSDAFIEQPRGMADSVNPGRPQAQSFTSASSSNRSSREIRENGACGRWRGGVNCPRAWEARSRLPFHMLPFEVQAYHLQQQQQRQQQQSHTLRYAESSEMSRPDYHRPDNEGSPPNSVAVVKSAEVSPPNPVAMAESAWFPLMPPALAGGALPPNLAASREEDLGGEIPRGSNNSSMKAIIAGRQLLEIATAQDHVFLHRQLRAGDELSGAARREATEETFPASCGREAARSGSQSASETERNCRLRPALGDPSSAWANPLDVRGSLRHGADASLSTPATAATAAGGQDPGLEARMSMMALVATSGFVEATRMVEVSLELGNACRERVRWSLRVADLTPSQLTEHLWPCRSSAAVAALGSDPLGTTRLKQRRRIERVWVDVDRAIDCASWPPAMKELRFGRDFNRPLERVKLPDGVQVLSFGNRFNQAVSRVRWPVALKELAFGNDFNQPVSGIHLPAGLRRLDLGGRFNFAIFAVDWPEGLRELRFGHGFNREIASMRWPPKLEKLEFCGEFQQRIEDVVWPRGLKHLALLGDFNQRVDAVDWPPVLRSVRFGDGFRQPLVTVRWPPQLERVVLGRDFDKPLHGCVWPPGLKELTIPFEGLLGEGRGGSGTAEGRGPVAAASSEARPNIPETCEVKVLSQDGRSSGNSGDHDDTPDGLLKADRNEGVDGISVSAGDQVFGDGEVDGRLAGCRCGDSFDVSDWEDGVGCSGCVDVFGYEADPWEADAGACGLRDPVLS